ncbi:hypothetical protein [Vibrio maritimus]|uniref:hypothetical protein n=1 Tax=Vibrio maritimus TaxID=990268 RepID=UPI001F43FB2A|nr:hypothetical protein [Vibrio maritimus]
MKKHLTIFCLLLPSVTLAKTYTTAQISCQLDEYWDPTEIHSFIYTDDKMVSYGSTFELEVIKPMTEDENGVITMEYNIADNGDMYFWSYDPRYKTFQYKFLKYKENGEVMWIGTGQENYKRCKANFS